jgi:hypothetical protein
MEGSGMNRQQRRAARKRQDADKALRALIEGWLEHIGAAKEMLAVHGVSIEEQIDAVCWLMDDNVLRMNVIDRDGDGEYLGVLMELNGPNGWVPLPLKEEARL